MKKRSLPARTALAAAVAAALLPAIADAAPPAGDRYPSRPIRFISPFLPGGSQDVIARIVGTEVGKRTGQQVVVDNRSGAAGIIATDITAHAQPDGYTILMITAGPITIAPNLQKKLPYDPMKDIQAVIHLVDTPMALIVNPAVPAKSVTELVAYAKAQGNRMNYASVGNGSISHLTMELFKMQTGVVATHVPYKGAAPAFLDLLSGQIPMLFITTASAEPYTNTGKARALAVAARKRSGMMPDVPTLTEAGVKGLDVPVWAGVATASGVPRRVVDTLYREFSDVLKQPEIRERLAKLGSDVNGDGPDAFGRLLKEDIGRWAKVIKVANVRVE